MKEYYNTYSGGVPSILVYITALSALIIVKKAQPTDNENILYILYIISAISLIYWHPHIQYYFSYFIFATLIIGNILERRMIHNKSLIPLLCMFAFSLYSIFPTSSSFRNYKKFITSAEFIMKETSDEKNIFDLEKIQADVFNKPYDYYWFGYSHVVIIDILTHPTHILNLNQQLKTIKPLYIRYQESTLPPLNDMIVFKNGQYFIKRNELILRKAPKSPDLLSHIINIDSDFYQLDTDWINSNYEKTYIPDIWKRKE